MHEVGIIQKIISVAADTAIAQQMTAVSLIKLKVGKMTGITREQLELFFQSCEKPDILRVAKIQMESVPVWLRCVECGYKYIDERFDNEAFAHSVSHAPMAYEPAFCIKCGSTNIKITSGQELMLVSLEEPLKN